MNERQDEEIKNVFRQYLAAEIRHPEVAKAKERFIQERFGREPLIIFRPIFFVPVLSALFVFLILFPMHKPALKPAAEYSLKESAGQAVVKEVPVKLQGIEINVERVSSEVGPTMVYQKDWHDQPLTVVWVFTGGVNQ